ncbi:unnamed protein product [Clavelina lepadiformis]|uniref:Major facilitator superfamily (MFS) profile domain-containing protein n=1 Tax=Clavelina lepadiformis TaxID=159417 RepID=A0ABP0G2L8_CLALP
MTEGRNEDDMQEKEIDKMKEEVTDDVNSVELAVYTRRWVILLIACLAIFLRGFNQSCYGPINNVFVKFFHIQPWQVDWFILTQSVVFLSMAFPLSLITARIGFKNSYVMMCAGLFLGFALTTVGVSMRTGYVSVIVGQCIMGFSNIISWSIPPPTAAIWFASNEVATAVALQVVGRGIGESIGSILTPQIVNPTQTDETIAFRLMWTFVAVTSIAAVITLASVFFVKDAPALPPSEARAQAISAKENQGNMQTDDLKTTLKQYAAVVKQLYKDPYFVAVWFVFGAVNPVLRNDSVLLSSVLHSTFKNIPDLDKKSGYVLMGGWIAYTVGGFIAGPIITKTKKYRPVVLISVGLECAATLVVMLGIKYRVLDCVYAGVVTTGLFLGMANTSLFELLVEVTYPKPTMLVTMVNIVGMGFFRLIYPIIGRVMLARVGPTASCAFPFALTLLSTIILVIIRPQYKRQMAQESELRRLLEPEESES